MIQKLGFPSIFVLFSLMSIPLTGKMPPLQLETVFPEVELLPLPESSSTLSFTVDTTTIFLLDETKERSTLIKHPSFHKKIESSPNQSLLVICPQSSFTLVELKSRKEEFIPQKECSRKEIFSNNQSFFCFEKVKLKDTPSTCEFSSVLNQTVFKSVNAALRTFYPSFHTEKKKGIKIQSIPNIVQKLEAFQRQWSKYKLLCAPSIPLVENNQLSNHLQYDPHLENHTSVVLKNEDQYFDLESTHFTRNFFALNEEESASIISRSIEFSRYKTQQQINEIPLDNRIYLSIALNEKDHDVLMTLEPEEILVPTIQKSKIIMSESIVALSIPNVKENLFSFDYMSEEQEIHLYDSKEIIDKYISSVQPSLNSLDFILPDVKQKDISPKKGYKKGEKIASDIPKIERMEELFARGERELNLKESPLSVTLSKEGQDALTLKSSFYRPSLPSFFPSEGVNSFDLDSFYAGIQEEPLHFVKKKMTLSEESVIEELDLLYLASKKVIPDKAPLPSHIALKDLPEMEKMVLLAMRDESYPNTRKLLEKGRPPFLIETKVEIDTAEIIPVETDMVQSEAKEMLEDYNQENRHSHGLIALEAPSLEISPKEAEAKTLNQSSRFTSAFLAEIPPPSHLETVTYTNEFETEVHYMKRDDGKGYYFAIKLRPNEKLNFASPSQNFIFVLDGSSSIKKHRFGVFKEGVARALSYLSDGDSFNVVIADAKLRSFSDHTTSWDKNSAEQARRFLLDQEYRGYFVNYSPFDLISKITHYFTPDRENIIILITDGHSFNSLSDHKDDFKELSKANNGKFSIFTATASQGNNLSMLDLLSTFNNGELMYSKTNASFSRQLAVLMKHIESFVAKNMHINVTGASLETGIEFYPNEKTLPALYADRPYMIYGSINKLKDFDMILQGRAGDQWINVKQSISFQHATQASHAIKKGIALQKAYVCYDYFMEKEDPFFLSEAQKLLEPLNIPTRVR